MNYSSMPTVEQANLDQFYEVIRRFDPELFLIKVALQETGVNPTILPRLIRMISNLSSGTGWGKINIVIQQKVVKRLLSEELDAVDEEAVVDK